MAQNDMFLYWGSGSAPCWKPMIVLEEKQLSGYGQKLISFSNKEHKSDEIMKINPRGQVSFILLTKTTLFCKHEVCLSVSVNNFKIREYFNQRNFHKFHEFDLFL